MKKQREDDLRRARYAWNVDETLSISYVQACARKGPLFEYSLLRAAKKIGPAVACRSAITKLSDLSFAQACRWKEHVFDLTLGYLED